MSDDVQTDIKVLVEAKRLLREVGWTKGAAARDVNGERFGNYDKAACFCMLGAVDCAANTLQSRASYSRASALMQDVLTQMVSAGKFVAQIPFWRAVSAGKFVAQIPFWRDLTLYFNDEVATCVEDVIGVLDACIEKLQEVG